MIKAFAGKASADGKQWLPLFQHLDDERTVMEKLLSEYVAPSVCTASGLSWDAFRKIAVFTACTHDIGKATVAFQNKIAREALPDLREHLKSCGFEIPVDTQSDQTPHNIASVTILQEYFGIDGSICEIIGSHHGKPIGREIEFSPGYQKKWFSGNYYTEKDFQLYFDTWKEIVDWALSYADIRGITNIPSQAKMLLSGLLIMADWIASDTAFFPLIPTYTTAVAADRFETGMTAIDLPPYHAFDTIRMEDSDFHDRFGFDPNTLQRAVIDIANKTVTPGLMIIEAPMGLGKTETALAAAETWCSSAGSGGIFFGLPTRSTADAMFDRIKNWASLLPGQDISSIALTHSSAEFNDSFIAVKNSICDEDRSGLSVNSWMTGRHRKLLSDFVIGTIDQALFSTLKKKFLMLLHLGLSGKTVIIDEVHSYDEYMSEFLKVMLSWLGAYKTPVILLSATLTRSKRDELIQAYTGHTADISIDAYPAITWTDDDKVFAEPIEVKDIRTIPVTLKTLATDDIKETLKERLSAGGCAGIVCDTVSRAQKIYTDLVSQFDKEYTIILLHSRFLPKDRTEIERQILARVGKKGTSRDKTIVIGTQVLEQSLDIDFDVMITEKCPIDLLLQRLGRLHRHKRDTRPEKVSNAVCYILTDEDACRSARIYDRYIIRRTDEVLAEHQAITIPHDIRALIESVYDLSLGTDAEDKKLFLKNNEDLRRHAQTYLLAPPRKCRFKGLLTVENVDTNYESVRAGINSMDFILLKKDGSGYITQNGHYLDPNVTPSYEEIKELLSNRISLRYDDDFHQEAEMTAGVIPDIWQQNCYLEDQNFLIAAPNGHFTIGSHEYTYTKQFGWRKEL